MSEESQPWDDEPEIKDEMETDVDGGDGDPGSAGGMAIVAITLSAVVVAWAFLGTVPKPVILLAGLWIMAATITAVAEVYGA